MKALFLLLVLLVVTACSIPEYGPPPNARVEASFWLHADTRFQQEERWIGDAAAKEIVRFTRGRANIAIAWDLDEESFLRLRNEPRMIRMTSFDPRVAAVDAQLRGRGRARGFQKAPFAVRDVQLPMTVGIVVDRAPELYPVMLHELGHAVGFDELPADQPGVMNSANPAWKWTRWDWEECHRVGLCEGSPP